MRSHLRRNEWDASRECPRRFVQKQSSKFWKNFRQYWRWTTQELTRNNKTPSCQKSRTMARQHVDQTSKRATSKASMKELKQEYWSRVKKGHSSARKQVAECFQWKATGQCSRGDSKSFNHGAHSGQRAQSSSSASRRPTQTDGRKPYKQGNLRGESPSG